MPADGVDALMKEQLAAILAAMGVAPNEKNAREDVHRWLESTAQGGPPIVAATWDADRTPRGFLDRHRTGARFSVLPEPVKEQALRTLRAWAVTTFGSLEAASTERHVFELRVFTFPDEVNR